MSAIVTKYYEIKDPNKLPPDTTVIDHYDNTSFIVKQGETLDQLLDRMISHRQEKGHPPITKESLRPFVLTTLIENNNLTQQQVDQYFVPHAALPQFSQAISFAKAFAVEYLHGKAVSIKERRRRAQKCLNCPHHRASGVGARIMNTLSNIVHNTFRDSATYPEETRLGTCGICGCPMQSKVKFSPYSILTSSSPDQLRILPNTLGSKMFTACWIIEDSLKDAKQKALLFGKLSGGNSNMEMLMRNLHNQHVSEQVTKSRVK